MMEIRGDEVWISIPKEARIIAETWSRENLVIPMWAAEALRDELVRSLVQ